MSLRYVFGPVVSRRLGRSLGVDPVPLKTCNWNCVYCQLGRTSPVTNERREYVPVDAVLEELARRLAELDPAEVDWVTLVGAGEPTLHSRIGDLVRGAKARTSKPVAVLTNGALLYRPEVRAELSAADAVLPTLDAGSPELYRRINRGHPELTFERLVDGLATFRAEFAGRFWLEVMLVRGLNDTEAALRDIAAAVTRIMPDEIHLNIPVRPPAEPWVGPPDAEGLMRARAILGSSAHVVMPVPLDLDLRNEADPVDAVVAVVTRHPIAEADLVAALERRCGERAADLLDALQASDRVKPVTRNGVKFWTAAATIHP